MHRQELDIFSDLSMHRCPFFMDQTVGRRILGICIIRAFLSTEQLSITRVLLTSQADSGMCRIDSPRKDSSHGNNARGYMTGPDTESGSKDQVLWHIRTTDRPDLSHPCSTHLRPPRMASRICVEGCFRQLIYRIKSATATHI